MIVIAKQVATVVALSLCLSLAPLWMLTLKPEVSQALVIDDKAAPSLSNDVVNFINTNVDPGKLRENLRFLSSRPHEAGTEAEVETAEWVAEQWRQFGLDEVEMASYNVLLSYPDGPNMVRLLDATSGAVLAENSPKQKPLYAPEESSDEVPFSFNAYAAPGNVTSSVVYANYGRDEDYKYLVDNGIDIAGKIVIARYGMVFRANMTGSCSNERYFWRNSTFDNLAASPQISRWLSELTQIFCPVSFAEKLGAAGVLLYTDPADYALDGPDSVYPHTVMMPPSGTQLGTVKLDNGDPLTPFYPSLESAFHIPEDEAPIPKIPVQPLSYEDAYFVLSSLGGPAAPPSWAGTLNITYRLGPTNPSYLVNMEVHTHNAPVVVHNVIGVIRGAEEPDRYVVLGNHRDAWVFGAIDPSSGTSSMVEVARVLSSMRNETGWRPRRSVVLCSWAAEEYGLVGSIEFVEQFSKQLQDRAVAYLNMDLAIIGNYSLKVLSAPMLYDVVWEAAQQVPNPDPEEAAAGRATVYDTWLARKPDPDDSTRPQMELVGSGSDYTGFMHNIGVTSFDLSYNHDESIPGWYPLYHTLYETFALVDELYDQGFLFQAAVTKLWALVAVSLTDPQVLPFSLQEYSKFITTVQQQINEDYGQLMAENNKTFDYFLAAGETFASRVEEFVQELPALDLNDALAVRRVNDQQMLVERSFLDSRGLPDRPHYNHVVLAPSASDAYTGTAFSGITDILNLISRTDDPEQLETLWRSLDEHLAAVTSLVLSSANSLTLSLW